MPSRGHSFSTDKIDPASERYVTTSPRIPAFLSRIRYDRTIHRYSSEHTHRKPRIHLTPEVQTQPIIVAHESHGKC